MHFTVWQMLIRKYTELCTSRPPPQKTQHMGTMKRSPTAVGELMGCGEQSALVEVHWHVIGGMAPLSLSSALYYAIDFYLFFASAPWTLVPDVNTEPGGEKSEGNCFFRKLLFRGEIVLIFNSPFENVIGPYCIGEI